MRFVFYLFILTNFVFAHGQNDYSQNFQKADSLLVNANYEEAFALFQSVTSHARKQNDLKTYFDGLNKISKILWQTGNFEIARTYADSIVNQASKEKQEEYLAYSEALNNIGIIHNILGDLDSALFFHKNVAEIRKSILGENSIEYGNACNNIGVAYWEKGNPREALKYYEIALDVIRRVYGEKSLDVADMYHNIGTVYEDFLILDQALSYLENANHIWSELLGPDHPDLSVSFTSTGFLKVTTGLFDLALIDFQEALRIDLLNFGEYHINTINSYNALGFVYINLEEFDKALHYLEIAHKNAKKVLGVDHLSLIEINQNLAIIYLSLGNVQLSQKTFDECLRLSLLNFGEKGLKHAENLADIGFILNSHGRLQEAEDYLTQSLLANQIQTVPIEQTKYTNIYAGMKFLQTFNQLITILDKKLPDLAVEHKLSEYVSMGVELIGALQKSMVSRKDKLNLAENALGLYEYAVKISVQQYFKNRNPQFLAKAIYYAELSHASVLSNQLSNIDAKIIAGVPGSLARKEEALKVEISSYLSLINELQSPSTVEDSIDLNQLQQPLFLARQSLDSLVDAMEVEFPKYHQMKYQNRKPEILEMQSDLEDHQLVLEYFESGNRLYLFSITNSKMEVYINEDFNSLKTLANQFKSQLENPNTNISAAVFQQTSKSIYDLLLQPVLEKAPENISQIIIIPPVELVSFPWEVLVYNEEGTNYRDFNYLLKKFSLSYAHSLSLFISPKKEVKTRNSGVLALAPTYNNKLEENSTADLKSIFRDKIVSLKWNKPEAESVVQSISGKVLWANEATEENFKSEASNYKILHLAMHALVDHEESMNSKLVFTQNSESSEDGMLYTFELFNMELPAEMVVLSACNTGIGEVQRGEGIMSLAGAFAYTGVPSLVMSHWNVNDESTAKLMSTFYEHLAAGKEKGEALRNAKLDFLDNANEIQAHPFYWGGFVLVGNTSPIDQNKSSYWWFLVVLPILGLILFSYRRRDRRN